jgi:signal transduction histidine kinase
VTYGIVRDAGGWIDLVTTVGKGTAVSVYLPVPAAEAP